MTKICKKCGIEFPRPRFPSGQLQPISQWEIREYCSKECFRAAQRGRRRKGGGYCLNPEEIEFLRLNYLIKGRDYCAHQMKVVPNYLTNLIQVYFRNTGKHINYVKSAPPPPKPVKTQDDLIKEMHWAWRDVARIRNTMRWIRGIANY